MLCSVVIQTRVRARVQAQARTAPRLGHQKVQPEKSGHPPTPSSSAPHLLIVLLRNLPSPIVPSLPCARPSLPSDHASHLTLTLTLFSRSVCACRTARTGQIFRQTRIGEAFVPSLYLRSLRSRVQVSPGRPAVQESVITLPPSVPPSPFPPSSRGAGHADSAGESREADDGRRLQDRGLLPEGAHA
jgi:hypothetical protein